MLLKYTDPTRTFIQGSVLVRYFTKFTKDIFASLVSLLFIISALEKLNKVSTII